MSGTAPGGRTRRADQATCDWQYLKSKVRRRWAAVHGAVPWVSASENSTTDPASASGTTTPGARASPPVVNFQRP